MITLLTIFHVIISLVLIVVVLIQSGKGQGIGAGLGGTSAAAQKMFGGGQTQSALGKVTIAIAALFMTTSISLAYFSSQPQSAMDIEKGERQGGANQGTVIDPSSFGGQSGGGAQGTDSSETNTIEVSPGSGQADESGGAQPAGDGSGEGASGASGSDPGDAQEAGSEGSTEN